MCCGGMYGRTAKVLAFETNSRYSYAAVDTGALYGEKCTENVRSPRPSRRRRACY